MGTLLEHYKTVSQYCEITPVDRGGILETHEWLVVQLTINEYILTLLCSNPCSILEARLSQRANTPMFMLIDLCPVLDLNHLVVPLISGMNISHRNWICFNRREMRGFGSRFSPIKPYSISEVSLYLWHTDSLLLAHLNDSLLSVRGLCNTTNLVGNHMNLNVLSDVYWNRPRLQDQYSSH